MPMPNAVVATIMEKLGGGLSGSSGSGAGKGRGEVHIAWIFVRSSGVRPAWYATALMRPLLEWTRELATSSAALRKQT